MKLTHKQLIYHTQILEPYRASALSLAPLASDINTAEFFHRWFWMFGDMEVLQTVLSKDAQRLTRLLECAHH